MKSVHLRGLGFVGLLTIFVLLLAACIQPPAPAGAPAPAEATATPAPAEAAAPAAEASAGDAEAGAYLASVIGCGCHMNQDLGGMAGGRAFEGDFGVVYAANVTSDPETGIADRSDEALVSMLRTGTADGYVLHPVMPYMRLSVLSDADAQNIVAFLRSLPPIKNAVPERELKEEPQPFTPASAPAAESPTEPAARGEYLVSLTNCGGCHTPRGENGAPAADKLLAGGKLQNDVVAPNLTPAGSTADWTEQDLATYLRTGKTPSGEDAQDPMAGQIKNRFSKFTEEDALAIAAYLKSLPAVENDPAQ